LKNKRFEVEKLGQSWKVAFASNFGLLSGNIKIFHKNFFLPINNAGS